MISIISYNIYALSMNQIFTVLQTTCRIGLLLYIKNTQPKSKHHQTELTDTSVHRRDASHVHSLLCDPLYGKGVQSFYYPSPCAPSNIRNIHTYSIIYIYIYIYIKREREREQLVPTNFTYPPIRRHRRFGSSFQFFGGIFALILPDFWFAKIVFTMGSASACVTCGVVLSAYHFGLVALFGFVASSF